MEKAYWLAWQSVPRIGPVLLKRIFERFGSLEMAWQASKQDLLEIEGLGVATVNEVFLTKNAIDPQALLAAHLQKNPNFWTPSDPEYPKMLWEIPDPPPVLYHLGSLKTLPTQSAIAIVGTRNPTGYGRRWAKNIAKALAEHGFVVVSGLAEGIDAEAHQSCIDAGGASIAVVGTGVDKVYPAKHLQLYQELQRSGAILSEYPAGTNPEKSHFPQRNRIIAGLCAAIIVIEAPSRSGALITAHQANDYGRDVYALPGSLDVEQSQGCLQLINRGAAIILGIDELLQSLGAIPQAKSEIVPTIKFAQDKTHAVITASKIEVEMALDPFQQKIMRVLSFDEPKELNRLVVDSELAPEDVSLALIQLEIIGAIAQLSGMRYQRLL